MLELSQSALANSMAILTAAVYLLFYLINLIAPGLFRFLFNAQFLGADVASLLPKECAAGNFIVALGFDGSNLVAHAFTFLKSLCRFTTSLVDNCGFRFFLAMFVHIWKSSPFSSVFV